MAITAKSLKGATCTLSGTSALTVSSLYSLTPPSVSTERIEVTSLSTSGTMKEYINPDFSDGGQFSFECDFAGDLPGSITSAIVFFGTAINKTWAFPASLASDSPASIGPNGVAKRTVSVNVNGAITVT